MTHHQAVASHSALTRGQAAALLNVPVATIEFFIEEGQLQEPIGAARINAMKQRRADVEKRALDLERSELAAACA
jgi:hypothetical protein